MELPCIFVFLETRRNCPHSQWVGQQDSEALGTDSILSVFTESFQLIISISRIAFLVQLKPI